MCFFSVFFFLACQLTKRQNASKGTDMGKRNDINRNVYQEWFFFRISLDALKIHVFRNCVRFFHIGGIHTFQRFGTKETQNIHNIRFSSIPFFSPYGVIFKRFSVLVHNVKKKTLKNIFLLILLSFSIYIAIHPFQRLGIKKTLKLS